MELSDEEAEKCVFENTIQALIATGNTPRGIMKVLNSVILDLKLDKDFLSVNNVKSRIDELYANKIDAHEDKLHNLTYLGYDEREDVTLMPNCKVKREPHMTVVDINGDYVTHAALYPMYDPRTKKVVTKGAINYSTELLKICGETDSRETLQILGSDGTNANTGAKGGANRYVEEDLGRPLLYNPCVFHATEKALQRYFNFVEKAPSQAPFYNGPIGKLIKDGVKLEPVVMFAPVAGLVQDYEKDFVSSMNNDLQLLYELCIAIQSGVFPEGLMKKLLAKVHKAR